MKKQIIIIAAFIVLVLAIAYFTPDKTPPPVETPKAPANLTVDTTENIAKELNSLDLGNLDADLEGLNADIENL